MKKTFDRRKEGSILRAKSVYYTSFPIHDWPISLVKAKIRKLQHTPNKMIMFMSSLSKKQLSEL